LEPNIDALKRLIARDAAAAPETKVREKRFRSVATPEARALELALGAVATLRVRGVLTGADLCRLAVLLGYDEAGVMRAWKTRAEFDPDTVPYELEVPLARVVSLD
jgi:hypothetical protein